MVKIRNKVADILQRRVVVRTEGLDMHSKGDFLVVIRITGVQGLAKLF